MTDTEIAVVNSLSFSNQLLPAAITLLAAITAVLYAISFVRTKPRRLFYLMTALVALYTTIVYFFVVIGVISHTGQVSEFFRPAVPVIFACYIAGWLNHAVR